MIHYYNLLTSFRYKMIIYFLHIENKEIHPHLKVHYRSFTNLNILISFQLRLENPQILLQNIEIPYQQLVLLFAIDNCGTTEERARLAHIITRSSTQQTDLLKQRS